MVEAATLSSQPCRVGTEPSVSVQALTFSYPKSPPVFSSLSTRFARGEITVVAGESGCGKTTLLYTLGLLHRPSAGSVRILGDETATLTDGARSRLRNQAFGFVFQDARLDQGRSIVDNVLEPAIYAGRARKGLSQRAHLLLHEMRVKVPPNRKASGISGGQAQRVALCRALLLEPPIILADEPTGNLDPVAAAAVLSRLRSEADSGKTVIIVSHDPVVIDAADRLIALGKPALGKP